MQSASNIADNVANVDAAAAAAASGDEWQLLSPVYVRVYFMRMYFMCVCECVYRYLCFR